MEASIKPVLQAIVDQCMNSGIQVTHTLAAMVLRGCILAADQVGADPKLWIQTSVQHLVEGWTSSASLGTLRLHSSFEARLLLEHSRLEDNLHNLSLSNKNLLSEIGSFAAKGQAAMDVLYRKIISYMIANSQLGETTDTVAVKETGGVLETLFPREELLSFVSCEKKDREFQVDELSVIVAGIRLLNREQGKGGNCIEDVPKLALSASEDLLKQVQAEMDNQQNIINKYKTVVCYQFEELEQPDAHTIRLVDESNNHHQFLVHETMLLEDATELKERLTELKGLYQESINGLLQAASASSDSKSLPPEKIYPMFMTLAKIWQQIEKERTQLQARLNLFKCLVNLKNIFNPTLSEFEVVQAQSKPISDTVSLSTLRELEAAPNDSGATVIDSKNIPSQSILEFKGFCPWTIVSRHGMLIKGDNSNAIVRYMGKYYSFANETAIREFINKPNEFINGVTAMVKAKSELIFLLELQDLFPSMKSLGSGVIRKGKTNRPSKSSASTVTKKDSETQTDTHPIPSYIDRNYCWNEWELRRNAIKLVELRYKATHSTQTKNSHFRRENATQHYAPKESTTQTGISTGTSPKITKNYVTGLRGKPTQKVKVVKLEFDL